MLSPKAWTVIHRIYDNVHAALWAGLCAGLLMFLVVVLPQMPKLQAAAETRRVLDAMAENRDYCDKWGMGPGSAKQAQCILDLQRLRTKIERRIAEETDMF